MATPGVRQVVVATASGGNAVASLGAGTSIGDLLLIWHGSNFNTAANMPNPTTSQTVSNQTLQATGDGGSNANHLKVWSAGVTVAGVQTTTTAPTPSGEEIYNVSYVLSGVSLAAFLDGTPAGGSGATGSTSFVAPSVTGVATSDALLLAGVAQGAINAVSGYTPPAGMTEDSDFANAGFQSGSTANQILTASGATGTRTFTFGGGTGNGGYASASIVIQGAAVAVDIPIVTMAPRR
jgi:hypothetical protein